MENATLQEIAAAFARWETDTSTNKADLFTPEELEELKTAGHHQRQAMHLLAHLRAVKGGN